MSALTVVMQREIREKKSVLVAAAVLGAVPPAVLLFARMRGNDATELASVLAMMVTAAMFFGTAAAAGSSAFSRELAEKRLAFYFARPMSELSLWGGKMLAAALLPCIAGAIPILLAALFGLKLRSFGVDDKSGAVLFMLTVMLLLVFMTHCAALGVRARSGWMALQVSAFAVAMTVIVSFSRAMLASGAVQYVGFIAACTAGMLLVALLLASFAGIYRGRSEIAEVQRHTAIVFSLAFLLLCASIAAYTAWVRSASRSEIQSAEVIAASEATVAVVRGQRSGGFDYMPTFVVNTVSGAEVRVPSMLTLAQFSEGGRAVWEELSDVSFRGSLSALVWADMNEAKPVRRETELGTGGKAFTVSRDGKRVSLYNGRTISVYDLDTEKHVASVPLASSPALWWASHTVWVSNDLLRMYKPETTKPDADGQRRWQIAEMSIGEKRVENVGSFRGRAFRFSPDRTRMYATAGNTLQILDARSGAALGAIPIHGNPQHFSYVLAGSKLVVLEGWRTERRLRVYSAADHKFEREIRVSPGAEKLVVGPAADTVLFAAKDGGSKGTLLLNTATGELSSYLKEAWPVTIPPIVAAFTFAAPGAPSTRLFESSDQVFVYDAKSGARTVIAGDR